MDAKKIKFPSASSMAKRTMEDKKKKKKQKPKNEDGAYMMGLMAQRRGEDGRHAAY